MSLESTTESQDGCRRFEHQMKAIPDGWSSDPEISRSKQSFDLRDDQ